MQARTIDLDGPVHVVDYGGDGPAVVCVHGLGGSHANWVAVGPRLAERARVMALDFPGFGLTPPGGRRADIRSTQRLLNRFVREVVGGPAILMGNSMGGTVALLQAAAQPDQVAGLILIDPSLPQLGSRVDPTVFRMFAAYALPVVGEWFLRHRRTQFSVEELVAQTYALMCVDASRVPPEAYDAGLDMVRRRAEMPWADDAFLQAARSLLRLILSRRRYFELIASVTAPTLVIHGAADRLVSVETARRMAGRHSSWTLEVLDDIGHVPQLEAPEEVVDVVMRWLDGSGCPAAAAALTTAPAARDTDRL